MLRRILARLQLDGELFLLTFPFIELQGGTYLFGSPNDFQNPPDGEQPGSQPFRLARASGTAQILLPEKIVRRWKVVIRQTLHICMFASALVSVAAGAYAK